MTDIRRRPSWLGAEIACAFVAAVLLLTILLGVNLATAGPVRSGFPGVSADRNSVGPLSQAPHTVHPSVRSQSIVGPIGGRLINTSTSPPFGDAIGNRIAVDPKTQTVYSANLAAGTVTVFSATTGTLNRWAKVVPANTGEYLTDIAFDPVHHQLFLSVERLIAPGFVLVLNSSTFATVANVSSFQGDTSYEPVFLTYLPITHDVFVENITGNDISGINTTTDMTHVRAVWACGIPCGAYGMVDVNQKGHSFLVIPSGNPSVTTFNYTALTFGSTITTTLSMPAGYGGYSPDSDYIWLTNATFGSNQIQAYTATLLAYGGTAFGPQYLTGLTYDTFTGDMVLTSLNFTAGYYQELWLYSDLGIELAHYGYAPAVPGQYFYEAVEDQQVSSDWIITAGSANGTTVAFSMSALTPYFTRALEYSSFPKFQLGLAVDPALGLYYVASVLPARLTAYAEATDAPVWNASLQNFIFIGGVSVDSAQGYVYVQDVINRSVNVYSAASGAHLKTIVLSVYPGAVAIDSEHHLLYIADLFDTNVTIYSTAGDANTLVGQVLTKGLFPCAIAADPTTTQALVTNCGTPGNVTTIDEATLTRGPVYAVGHQPSSIAVNSTGAAFVGNSATHNVTILNPVTSSVVGSIPTLGFGDDALVPCDATGFLCALNYTISTVEVLGVPGRLVLGSFPYPGSLGSAGLTGAHAAIGFDPVTDTLLVSLYTEGQTFRASLVALPAAPAGVAVTPHNNSATISWSAAASPPGFPVTNYTVLSAPSASGPWSLLAVVPGLSVSATGLTDGVAVYVTVYAASAAGVGPRSGPASGIPGDIPYPPTAVTATAAGSSKVNVSWGAPVSNDGSAVTGYTVFFSSSASGPFTAVNAGGSLSITLVGLSAGTRYTVYVEATNGFGPSHPSVHASATTQATPAGAGSAFAGSLVWIVLAIIVLAVIVAGLALWMRRRKSAGAATAPPPTGATMPPAPPAPPTGPMEGPPPGAA